MANAPSVRRLYVIRLDEEVWSLRRFREANPDRRMDKPCVYVGQTSLDPAVRFEQHKRGYRSSRIVRRFGLRLDERRTRNQPPVPWRDADAAERRLAERLRRRGFGVWQN